jgi:hypothetical protein
MLSLRQSGTLYCVRFSRDARKNAHFKCSSAVDFGDLQGCYAALRGMRPMVSRAEKRIGSICMGLLRV